MLTFDGVWHFGEVFSSQMNPGFHCTGKMADIMYGFVWVSGLPMSTLWIEWPMVVVGLWYGQAYVYKERCDMCSFGLVEDQSCRDQIDRYNR